MIPFTVALLLPFVVNAVDIRSFTQSITERAQAGARELQSVADDFYLVCLNINAEPDDVTCYCDYPSLVCLSDFVDCVGDLCYYLTTGLIFSSPDLSQVGASFSCVTYVTPFEFETCVDLYANPYTGAAEACDVSFDGQFCRDCDLCPGGGVDFDCTNLSPDLYSYNCETFDGSGASNLFADFIQPAPTPRPTRRPTPRPTQRPTPRPTPRPTFPEVTTQATTTIPPPPAVTPLPPPQTIPAGTIPAGAIPAGVIPAGTIPTGTIPAGTIPAGTIPGTDPFSPSSQQQFNGVRSSATMWSFGGVLSAAVFWIFLM